MRNRTARLGAIRRLVGEKEIGTQEELRRELELLNHRVTQATVSRDMATLRLEKTRRGEGRVAYSLPEIERLRSLSDFVTGVQAASNLVIVRTSPGAAQGVAAALDAVGWTEILGTVAGDDTILAVTREEAAAQSLTGRLSGVLGAGESGGRRRGGKGRKRKGGS